MGLEIILLSFIPLISNNDNMFTTDASLKYFLIQALACYLRFVHILLHAAPEKEIQL